MSYFRQVRDQYGFVVENTPMDEMRVVIPSRLVGATFSGTANDSNFWTIGTAAEGTVTQANNQVSLITGTAADGSASLKSVRTARYTGGQANRFRAQVQLSDIGTANNIRSWGAFNGTDGACFELNGTTLNAVTWKTGTATRVAGTAWDVPLSPTLTNCNSYEIYWTNSKVYFVVNGTLGHTKSASTATWSDTTNLPVYLQNYNSGSSTVNGTLQVRVATIYRLGDLETNPQYYHSTAAATVTLKNIAGRLHSVSVNNPTNNAFTLYDSVGTSTSVIAVVDPDASATPFFLNYNLPFANGLTLVTAGTPDLTIIYE